MSDRTVLLALPGFIVLCAGFVTFAWAFWFRARGWLPGRLPLLVACITLVEGVASGTNNGLVHMLPDPTLVKWAGFAGFLAAFLLLPLYVLMLALVDSPLTNLCRRRSFQVGALVFALACDAVLWLWPNLLVAGVSPRAYAAYNPDFTPLTTWLMLGSAAILVFGVVAVFDAVRRVKDPAARTPLEKTRAFADVILHGARGTPNARHLRALFLVFTLRDLLMAGWFLGIALLSPGAPRTYAEADLHFWWSPVVDMLTGTMLVWHVVSDAFAEGHIGLSRRSRAAYLAGWFLMCLLAPALWTIQQDTSFRWVADGVALLAGGAATFYLGGFLKKASDEMREKQREGT